MIRIFNEQYGNVDWADEDRVRTLISTDIAAKVAADEANQQAQSNSDEQNARTEHDKALQRVMNGVLKDDTQLSRVPNTQLVLLARSVCARLNRASI